MTKNICRYFLSVGRGRPHSLLRKTLNRVLLALTSVEGAPSAYAALFSKDFAIKMSTVKCMTNGKGADNK